MISEFFDKKEEDTLKKHAFKQVTFCFQKETKTLLVINHKINKDVFLETFML